VLEITWIHSSQAASKFGQKQSGFEKH